MNKRIIKSASLLIVVIAVLFALSGGTRSSLRQSAVLAFQPTENQAPANDKPDTRRDVFIAARNAVPAPALSEGAWVNSEPLTLESLRGRVVIVDFWTFGCYNCRNTLPTLKRWDARYRERGLTIIGVHSPEFDREKDVNNVRREVRSLGIRYPVVTDNDYETWRAYGIEAWPTTVILDKQGRIRWTHIGEGMYGEMEDVIGKLLAEDYKGESTSKSETATDFNDGQRAASIKAGSESDIGKKLTMTEKVIKSDEEWQEQLSTEQFYVMRRKGTERAFTGAYYKTKEKGVYLCAACGNALFSSDAKFDSGTGWPSYWAPIAEENIETETDTSYGMKRTEVKCRKCGSHLGHVFDDGPQPTGLRYCINSIALKLEKKQ